MSWCIATWGWLGTGSKHAPNLEIKSSCLEHFDNSCQFCYNFVILYYGLHLTSQFYGSCVVGALWGLSPLSAYYILKFPSHYVTLS